ncbi:MAG TPA: chromate efflux transporter [Chloroflexia bacterium]|nr:chromate efflux transporter [Chloroflexia bacterium]
MIQPRDAPVHPLAEVAGLFLRLGCTAFGGPAAHVAMMREEVVRRRRWITDAQFLDLLGITNLIPGPNSTELAIYLGYLRAGRPGLLVAGVCFIGPAMAMVLVLAWAYVTYGALPQVAWLFYGIQPVVVGIIAQALWGLGRAVLRGAWPLAVGALVLGLQLLGLNPLLLLFGGGLLYASGRRLGGRRPQVRHLAGLPLVAGRLREGAGLAGVVVGAGAAGAAPFSLLTLFLTFLKIGALLYGSGYVLLAFLRNDFVLSLGWLTDRQLLDAVSVGQFTPGPVFTTATFIGYLVGGWPGAVLATLGIFLPSFVFVALIPPLAARLRSSRWTAPLLDGVNVAALALMAGVLVQLGQAALRDGLTWGLALGTAAILLRYKINSVWLILAGAALGVLRFWLL